MKVHIIGFLRILAFMSALAGVVYVMAGWRYGFDRLPPFLGFPSLWRATAAVIFVSLLVYVTSLMDRPMKVKR